MLRQTHPLEAFVTCGSAEDLEIVLLCWKRICEKDSTCGAGREKSEVVCEGLVVCGELPLVANTDLKPRSGYQGRLFHGTYQILIYSRAVRETPLRERERSSFPVNLDQ